MKFLPAAPNPTSAEAAYKVAESGFRNEAMNRLK